jgi:hypothetical protein
VSLVVLLAKYYYAVKIEVDEMTCYVACVGEKGNACKVLVGNPKGKRLLGRYGHRWEDNNKIDLQELEWV